MKNLLLALLFVGALIIHNEKIYSSEIDEIVVTSSYIDKNLSDLDDPIHVIGGDDATFDTTVSSVSYTHLTLPTIYSV